MEKNQIDNAFNDYSETHCKYESLQHQSRFLRSVQTPINGQESGLRVSQYIKKIKFLILIKTKIFNPKVNHSETPQKKRQTKPPNYHSIWRMVFFPIYSASVRRCVRTSRIRKCRGRPDPCQKKMLFRICLETTTTTNPIMILRLRLHQEIYLALISLHIILEIRLSLCRWIVRWITQTHLTWAPTITLILITLTPTRLTTMTQTSPACIDFAWGYDIQNHRRKFL